MSHASHVSVRFPSPSRAIARVPDVISAPGSKPQLGRGCISSAVGSTASRMVSIAPRYHRTRVVWGQHSFFWQPVPTRPFCLLTSRQSREYEQREYEQLRFRSHGGGGQQNV